MWYNMIMNKFCLIITLFLSFSLCACSGLADNINSSYPVSPAEEVKAVSQSASASKNEPPKTEKRHLKLSLPDSGDEIFSPDTSLGLDYRYGPSIMLNDDGSLDAWFSSPSFISTEFDWLTYRHSDDRGKTWSNETIVMYPTPNSRDALSVCDPDVFYYNGYYYLGYTSTIDESFNGLSNSIFLARSEKPNGPFLKWNGSGWGGNPEPIIYYDGVSLGWGIGEPSFVIVDNTLYLYATKDSYSKDFLRIKSTAVYSADIREDNWPKKLKYIGCAVVRSDTGEDAEYVYSDCDSWDVAYVEENKMFLAICTNRRFTEDSCLLYYESADGINFNRVSELNTNVVCGCHNCGISSDKNGHIKKGDNTIVGYAYCGADATEWGVWATRFAPLRIDAVDKIADSEDSSENLRLPISDRKKDAGLRTTGITTDKLKYQQTEGNGVFYITYYRLISNYSRRNIDASEITFSDYDKNIVSVSRNMIEAKSAGTTPITISYRGFSRQICLCVLPRGMSQDNLLNKLVSPTPEYNLSMQDPFAVAIRPLVVVSDLTLNELTNDEVSRYNIKIESEDEKICTVRDDAVITAVSPGDTVIRVSAPSSSGYEVKIHVTE